MEIIIHIQQKHSTNVQHNTEINGNSEKKNASPVKQILRRYEQPSEFSEFPWYILRQIFLPQDRKTIKKTANPSLRWRPIIRRGISAFNFRWFRQPIISCCIVLTATQRCGQNLAASSTSLWEFVWGPILAGARKREWMRTAKIWPDLRLPCLSLCYYLSRDLTPRFMNNIIN